MKRQDLVRHLEAHGYLDIVRSMSFLHGRSAAILTFRCRSAGKFAGPSGVHPLRQKFIRFARHFP